MRFFTSIWAGLPLISTVAASYVTVASRYNTTDSIRYKEFADGQICKAGQKHYTGWADLGDRHIFYWYHPARTNKPAPVMIWLQGGPGGSSISGMLLEHGPCLLPLDGNETVFNPYSWSEAYNVIYIDQPADVGFSYVTNSTGKATFPRRSEESALDFVRALRLFPDAFPELEGLPVYIAGESYGGRYVPVYGAAVLDYNDKVPKEAKIPLASIMVGNGLTNMREQWPALYDTACFTHHGIPPIFNSTECKEMADAVDRCERLSAACEAQPDEMICFSSNQYCSSKLFDIMDSKNNNRYDRTQICKAPNQCYPLIDQIGVWLNSELVLEALEIKSETPGIDFTSQSSIISDNYIGSGDFGTSSVPDLQRVLKDPEVQVLYYVGVNDWACNAVGVKRMLENVQWENHAEFRGLPMEELPWKTKEGTLGGFTKAVERLHYVELMGGGHLIPYDQPESTLTMVTIWIQRVESAAMGKENAGNDNPFNFHVQSGVRPNIDL